MNELSYRDDKARRRILQYAASKFAANGYSNVSIAQFAAELKMSKSTLYKYFQSKEQLLFAVIEQFYAQFEQEVDAIVMDREPNVARKIKSFLLIVRQRFASLHVSAVEDMRLAVPEAYELVEERRKRIITGNLIRLFEQGAADGYFRSDVPPVLIANMLLHSLQQLEHPQFMAETPYTFTDMFHHVFSILMEGSLSEKGRNELV